VIDNRSTVLFLTAKEIAGYAFIILTSKFAT